MGAVHQNPKGAKLGALAVDMCGVSVHKLAVPGCPEARGVGPTATKKENALRRDDIQMHVGSRNEPQRKGVTDKVLLPADTTALLKLKYWSQSVDAALTEMG